MCYVLLSSIRKLKKVKNRKENISLPLQRTLICIFCFIMALRSVGFLRRNFSACSANAKTTIYTTMVRPVLEYASTVWDPVLKSDSQKLEKFQRSAARYIFNNYKRTPGTVTGLLDKLQWDSLEECRLVHRLTMLYKIQKGLMNLNPSNFFLTNQTVEREGTRGTKRDPTIILFLQIHFFQRLLASGTNYHQAWLMLRVSTFSIKVWSASCRLTHCRRLSLHCFYPVFNQFSLHVFS